MRLDRSDLKGLRLPLAAGLAMAAFGVAALLLSQDRLIEERRAQKTKQEQLRATRERVARFAEEEHEIRDNLVHFQTMERLGMIGAEKRLEWVEAIAAIRQQRHLYEIRYTVEAQRSVDYPGVAPAQRGAGLAFMASRLKFDMQLLHEGDLLQFLSDLNAAGNAYVSVRNCSISRAEGAGARGGPLRPRLRASCTIDMITLRTAA